MDSNESKALKVLSLFDGISCGRVALERVGIPIERYDAYEIDEYAIKVAQKNSSIIQHHGDVTTADFKNYFGYDLLIGGSPCQSLANCNMYLKDGEYGVNGTGASRLFWEYVRALKTINPKYFFFENVASMRNADRDIITEQLGIEPIKINSLLFSAQVRNRLYWTNIPFDLPTERVVNTELKDVLEDKDGTPVADRFYICEGTVHYVFERNDKWVTNPDKFKPNPQFSRPLVASGWKIHRADTEAYIETEYAPVGRSHFRRLTPIEYERLQGLPDNYTLVDGYSEAQSNKQRWKCVGNGWQVDTIAHIFKGLTE